MPNIETMGIVFSRLLVTLIALLLSDQDEREPLAFWSGHGEE
jgi:hypothetical protein